MEDIRLGKQPVFPRSDPIAEAVTHAEATNDELAGGADAEVRIETPDDAALLWTEIAEDGAPARTEENIADNAAGTAGQVENETSSSGPAPAVPSNSGDV